MSIFFDEDGNEMETSKRYANHDGGGGFGNVTRGLNAKSPSGRRATKDGRTHLTVISSTNEPKAVPKPSWVGLMVKDWIGGE